MKNTDKIQLVDLRNQYHRIKQEIDSAILETIDSCNFINGPEVKLFASNLQNYLGVKHVIPCGNGTDALQIALMALNLKEGDEVITPSFTYVATVEVITLLKLKPVFVEVDEDLFTIDVNHLESLITSKTKAIIPVHLYGQCADMERIIEIANKNKLHVIEDTAQALGADYTFSNGEVKKAGTIGTIGCTSFFPSKNLGCFGDGGAMFTNDEELAKKLGMISNHGQSKKYHHDFIGVNSRLDSIQAAVLNVKLEYLNDYRDARNRVANYYNNRLSNLPGIQVPKRNDYSNHVFHQYTIKLEGINRDELLDSLKENGIPVNVYYPVPVHLQKGYKEHGCIEGDLPLTEKLTKVVLSLPIHTEMKEEELNYICNRIEKSCFELAIN